jgi:hypothetical protein
MQGNSKRRWSIFPILALLPLGNCVCDNDDLNVIAPQIYVDKCASPYTEVDGQVLGGYEECALEFGTSDISVRVSAEITVSNPSTVDLTIDEIAFTTDSDPAFHVEAAPEVVEAGLSNVILISFRPNVESEISGTLYIKSDAVNLPDGQDVIIPVTGVGVDNGIPNINVTPLECNFGRVAAGSVKECTVVLENDGNRELVFDSVAFLEEHDGVTLPTKPADSAEEPFGFFGRPPARDDVIAAPPENNVVNLPLRFTPDVLGSYAAKIEIITNDPDEPNILVDLIGVGVEAPVCEIAIKTVNGAEYTPTVAIEPLDDIILTSESSSASTASGSITSVEWVILDRPQGSTAALSNPGGIETGFTFADVQGIDLAGRYRLRATVFDDLDTESVNVCELEFEAIPTDTILAQLSWDTDYGDMDLHLIKEDSSGRFCANGVSHGPLAQDCGFSSEQDCYYGNCKSTSGGSPDWDENGIQFSDGDPSLDIDDLSGYGPENINIDVAPAGKYLVGVDFFGGGFGSTGSGLIGNTIRIYLYGQLQAEFFSELSDSDWWEVAVIHWPGVGAGAPCIEDLSTTNVECP